MSLPSPNLDDRTFQQLLDECVVRIRKSCPQWTDLSPGDPGIVLLELFAYLTETMIYRLNRVPEKAYVEFLRLLGVKLLPPAAASARLRFRLKSPQGKPVEIPRGTRVTLMRTSGNKDLPVFVTLRGVTIPAGQLEAYGTAVHAEWIEAELVGKGSGLPGQSVFVKRPPIIAPLGDRQEMVVGVEAEPGEIDERAPALKLNEKTFRVWREVDGFANLGDDRCVYTCDRALGLIQFAPALYGREASGQLAGQPQALADAPRADREIRVWYLRGGGLDGDVGPDSLKILKDPILGVEVTNPEAATGGSALERIENALVRGPMELHTVHRAVTARDFEVIALRSSGAVARARAFTKAALWKHATPGTVELLLVPAFPRLEEQGWKVAPEDLRQRETEDARNQIQRLLDERRPLGTVCLVNWVRHKTVRVKARIICHREDNPDQIRERVLRRLHQTINPLPAGPSATGWRYGQSLRAFHVYDIILAEPGVKYVDRVRLFVDDVPDRDVTAVAADASQPRVWYAASGERLFRSVNDGDGWEEAQRFDGASVRVIRVHADFPGRVAIGVQAVGDKPMSRLLLSDDCGESWRQVAQMPHAIDDIAWLVRNGAPALLLATAVGLYEMGLDADAVPVQIIVDAKRPDMGFYAVAVSTDFRGKANVAVAACVREGVWLSTENGLSHSFTMIGLKGQDARILEAQEDGPRRFLWAGVRTPGFEEGAGCFRWDLTNSDEGWLNYNRSWAGGSCLGLAFYSNLVLAATHHAGVLWTDSTKDPGQVTWQSADVNCGLPLKEVDRYHAVQAVAADPGGKWFLAGGEAGIFRSSNGGRTYDSCSSAEFVDKVSLPDTWLFCSGEHDIEIVSENEAGGN